MSTHSWVCVCVRGWVNLLVCGAEWINGLIEKFVLTTRVSLWTNWTTFRRFARVPEKWQQLGQCGNSLGLLCDALVSGIKAPNTLNRFTLYQNIKKETPVNYSLVDKQTHLGTDCFTVYIITQKPIKTCSPRIVLTSLPWHWHLVVHLRCISSLKLAFLLDISMRLLRSRPSHCDCQSETEKAETKLKWWRAAERRVRSTGKYPAATYKSKCSR